MTAQRPDPAEVVAVLVTWNSARHLEAALSALPAAFAGVPSWGVVVVDNASTDGSLDLVARVAPEALRVQTGRNAGYGAGVNAGIAASPAGRAHLVLNPDLTLAPGSVGRLLACLDEPGVGIAVPHQRDPAGRLLYSQRREPSVLRAFGEALLGGNRAGRIPMLGETVVRAGAYADHAGVDWASGSAMLVRSRCAADVGPWDESYFLYSEETDFALRARDLGWTVRYCPDARAVHVGGDSHVSPMLYSLLTLNRVRLFRRRHGPVATSAFTCGVTLNEVLRSRRSLHRHALRALWLPSARRQVLGWRP